MGQVTSSTSDCESQLRTDMFQLFESTPYLRILIYHGHFIGEDIQYSTQAVLF